MQSGDRRIGVAGGGGETDRPESIRDIQRRRREATRGRAGIEAVLSSGTQRDEEEEEEGDDEPVAGPAPAKVYVVFRGTSWRDPAGDLRESDTIVGVYGSEHAARIAVAALEREKTGQAGEAGEAGENGEADAWYQPYAVQD
jgi:hypothetical protein